MDLQPCLFLPRASDPAPRQRLPWWWPAVVAAAFTVLHHHRLPNEVSAMESLLLALALPVVLLPASRHWPSGAGAAALYVASCLLGMFVPFRWLAPALVAYGRLRWPSAVAAMLLVGAALGLSRLALCSMVRFLARGWGDSVACLLGASLMVLHDSALNCLAPWHEPATLGFALADLPGAPLLVRIGGPALLALCTLIAGLALVRRTTWLLATIPLFVLILAWLMRTPEAPSHWAKLEGLQLHPQPRGATWREELLAAYLRAESHEPAGIVVWPETACPYTERLRADRIPCKVPQPDSYSRLFGLHTIERIGHLQNAAVLQQSAALEANQVRQKQTLVPVYERNRLIEASGPDHTLRWGAYSLVAPICYEIFDRSRYVGLAASLGISISSDAFDPSGQASKLMTKATWLRALECGIPFARVSDTSFSAAFSADGGTLASLPKAQAVLWAELPVSETAHACGKAQRLVVGGLVLLVFLAAIAGWLGGRKTKATN